MVAAIFGPLPRPMASVAVTHHMASATAIKDINAIAGIIILIIPAAAEADIGKAIAIVAGIIIVERSIGIAIITTVDIAVAIIAGAIHAATQSQ